MRRHVYFAQIRNIFVVSSSVLRKCGDSFGADAAEVSNAIQNPISRLDACIYRYNKSTGGYIVHI